MSDDARRTSHYQRVKKGDACGAVLDCLGRELVANPRGIDDGRTALRDRFASMDKDADAATRAVLNLDAHVAVAALARRGARWVRKPPGERPATTRAAAPPPRAAAVAAGARWPRRTSGGDRARDDRERRRAGAWGEPARRRSCCTSWPANPHHAPAPAPLV